MAPENTYVLLKHTTEALSRHYPTPTTEHTVEELLAREPQKWTFANYLKTSREVQPITRTREEKAKALANAKQELLAFKRELDGRLGSVGTSSATSRSASPPSASWRLDRLSSTRH